MSRPSSLQEVRDALAHEADFLDLWQGDGFVGVRGREGISATVWGVVSLKVRDLGGRLDGALRAWVVPIGEDPPERLRPVLRPGEVYMAVPLSRLVPPRRRLRSRYNPEHIDRLTRSVGEKGVIEPLRVRPLPSGMFEVSAGDQRFVAARGAGLSEVPCIVKQMGDREAFEVGLAENLERDSLSDYDVACALRTLLRDWPGEYPSQRALAEKLGRSEYWVSSHLAILEAGEEKGLGDRVVDLTAEQAVRLRAAAPERRREAVKRARETGILPSARELRPSTSHATSYAMSNITLNGTSPTVYCPLCSSPIPQVKYSTLMASYGGLVG